MAVKVGINVWVGVRVFVGVRVIVGVRVSVGVRVLVGVRVTVDVRVGVPVRVGVLVVVGVRVWVGVCVAWAVRTHSEDDCAIGWGTTARPIAATAHKINIQLNTRLSKIDLVCLGQGRRRADAALTLMRDCT